MGLTQVLSRRARWWTPMLLPVAAALWGSGGCGGVVTDSGRGRDGGPNGAETGGSPSIPGGGGSKPKPPTMPSCGNGVVEGNELCDGKSFRSDVDTCVEALMASYSGQLYCSPSCTIDTSGCYPTYGGAPNVGGAPNGGFIGYGGRAGGGGLLGGPTSPTYNCYTSGGVPDPASPNGCSYGVDAVNACFAKPGRTTCVDKCGCSNCANAYDHCKTEGACGWLLDCARGVGCYSASSCYQMGCSGIINQAGGVYSAGAMLLDQVLSCFTANNCPVSC